MIVDNPLPTEKSTIMRFLCDHCDGRIETDHYWTGLTLACPHCGESTELRYRNGQSIPWTGIDITFTNFKQFMTNSIYAEAVDPLVSELLGCTVERTEAGARLTAADGSLIPWEAAHIAIQSDRVKQGRIYNTAMNMWR
jgi:hypothetical protein